MFEAVGQLMLLTHFSELVSGSNKTRVPYTDLAERTSLLVDPKYLPSGFDFKFKDPRNMTKDAIVLFFSHAFGRQQMFGPTDAFRFKGYIDREGKVVEALYPATDAEPNGEPAVRSSNKGSKKKETKGKAKAKAKNIQPNEENSSTNPQSGVPWNSLYRIRQVSEEAVLPNGDTVDSGPSVESPMQDFVSISHHDMTLLIAQGYPPHAPINGPNEGMPEYVVPRSELSKLSRVPKPRPRPKPTCQIDPALLEDAYTPTRVRGSLLPGTASGTASVFQPTASITPSMASLPSHNESNLPAIRAVSPGLLSRPSAPSNPAASNTASATDSVSPITAPSGSKIASLNGNLLASLSVSGAASSRSSVNPVGSKENEEAPSSHPEAGSAVIKKKRKGGDALALQEAQKLLPKRHSKRLKTNKR